MRLLGIIFCCVLMAICFVSAANHFGNFEKLVHFVYNDSIELLGVMLSIYLAAVYALYSIILASKEKGSFAGTREELRENIIGVLGIFALHAFIVLSLPSLTGWYLVMPLTTVFIFIYAIYELSEALFSTQASVK